MLINQFVAITIQIKGWKIPMYKLYKWSSVFPFKSSSLWCKIPLLKFDDFCVLTCLLSLNLQQPIWLFFYIEFSSQGYINKLAKSAKYSKNPKLPCIHIMYSESTFPDMFGHVKGASNKRPKKDSNLTIKCADSHIFLVEILPCDSETLLIFFCF